MKKILRSIPVAMGDSISVQLDYEDGTKRVIKYARFLMENHLGRELTMLDIVLHRDGNTMNFAIDNLELTTKLEQTRSKHRARYSVDTLESRVTALVGRHQKRVNRKAAIEVAPVAKKTNPPRALAAFICGQCEKPAQKSKNSLQQRQKLGKPAFCSNSCASKYNFHKNPKLQESFRLASEKLRLEAEAKRLQAQIAALTPSNGKVHAVA